MAVAPTGGGQLLAPGKTLRVETGVDLPATRNQPFGNDLGHGKIALPEDLVAVRFCLGVIASPVPPALKSADAGDGMVTFAHGNAGMTRSTSSAARSSGSATTDPGGA